MPEKDDAGTKLQRTGIIVAAMAAIIAALIGTIPGMLSLVRPPTSAPYNPIIITATPDSANAQLTYSPTPKLTNATSVPSGGTCDNCGLSGDPQLSANSLVPLPTNYQCPMVVGASWLPQPVWYGPFTDGNYIGFNLQGVIWTWNSYIGYLYYAPLPVRGQWMPLNGSGFFVCADINGNFYAYHS